MPWKQDDPKWIPEPYPKMLTQIGDDGVPRPVVYPATHPKGGQQVIFADKDEEKAYKK